MAFQIVDSVLRPEYSNFFLVFCWDVDCRSWCRVQVFDSVPECISDGFKLIELFEPSLRPNFEVWWAGISMMLRSHKSDSADDDFPYDYPFVPGVYRLHVGKSARWVPARWEHTNAP